MNRRGFLVLVAASLALSIPAGWLVLPDRPGAQPAKQIALDEAALRPPSESVVAGDAAREGASEDRELVAIPAIETAPARADLREILRELNTTSPPSRVYTRFRELFVSNPELARLAAQTLLTEVLALNRSASLAGAVVSAWLDAEPDTEAVVAACLGCLEGTIVDGALRLRAARTLADGLKWSLRQSRDSLPPPDAAMPARLLAALTSRCETGLPSNSAMATITVLQSAPADARIGWALVRLIQHAESDKVRLAAIAALAAHASPAEIVATLGAASAPITEDEKRVGTAMLLALHASTRRHGGDRAELHRWIRQVLGVPAATSFQEDLQLTTIMTMEQADVQALHALLQDLAAHSPSASVRWKAGDLLAKSR